MKLERVKHADVYPSDGNPRRDFGDLKSMAEGFQLNPENPGEPLTPPIVVRDGQVFRIVDGERRWRAMQIAGTKEFSAIVCDDWDDADAALAMLATDDKKALDEVERSRGVQRCLLLGVTEEKLEKSARVKGAGRLRRAMDRVGVDSENMTLDHLFAVAEFDGDPERAEKVANADERSWQRVAEECRRDAKRQRAHEALTDKAAELGLRTVEERNPEGMAYVLASFSPDDLEADAAEHPGAVWYVDPGSAYAYPKAIAYEAAGGDAEEDPEVARRKEEAAQIERDLEAMVGSMRGHLVERLMAGEYPEHVMAMAVAEQLGDPGYGWSRYAETSEWLDEAGYDGPRPDGRMTGMAGASALRSLLASSSPRYKVGDFLAGVSEEHPDYVAKDIERLDELMAAAMDDGWKTDERGWALVKATGAWMAAYQEAAAEKEDEE